MRSTNRTHDKSVSLQFMHAVDISLGFQRTICFIYITVCLVGGCVFTYIGSSIEEEATSRDDAQLPYDVQQT